MRFWLTTLGCKVNQYESRAIASALAACGLEATTPSSGDPVDLAVINTCCVTTTAMAKSRAAISRSVRRWKGADILVVGCYCDYDGARIRSLLAGLGVDSQKVHLAGHHDDVTTAVKRVATLLKGRSKSHAGIDKRSVNMADSACSGNTPATLKARRSAAITARTGGTEHLPSIAAFSGHQRAFVKVQDGCDAFCAYCIVPYARGRLWSRNIDDILAECRHLVAVGHKEIVLCGVFLGAYGRTTAIRGSTGSPPRAESRGSRWPAGKGGKPPLLNLIAAVAGIKGLWRLRLSSIECNDINEEFLAACRQLPNLSAHFHPPLQSGSDLILRAMNRKYTADQFLQAVENLRRSFDRPAITTDILVGYPNESEEDFAQTLNIARKAGFAKIHAFPFSAIEGTAAWGRRRQAPPPRVVKERLARLAELERELAADYRRQFVGGEMEGLVESTRNGQNIAMTDRYLTVSFPGRPVNPGQLVRLAIEGIGDEHLQGRLREYC